MTIQENQLALDLYRGLMEEAKSRAFSINTITNDQRGLPSHLVREYCYLQLRMLCEIVALGCLVAHGDIVASGPASLRKAYVPDDIFRSLGELHPDFFPVPVRPVRTAIGWDINKYEGPPALTKKELVEVWGKCGDVLHRGNLRRLVGPKRDELDDKQVGKWGQQILNLLSAHTIVRLGGKETFITFLEATDHGGAVVVAFGAAP